MNFNEFVDEFKNDDSREFIKKLYFKKILKNDQMKMCDGDIPLKTSINCSSALLHISIIYR